MPYSAAIIAEYAAIDAIFSLLYAFAAMPPHYRPPLSLSFRHFSSCRQYSTGSGILLFAGFTPR